MGQRLEILLPELSSILRTHVRLATLVGLVISEGDIGVTWLYEFGKVADLLCTPQHDGRAETELLGPLGDPRTPGIDDAAPSGLELVKSGRVAVGPGDADLASHAAVATTAT